MIDIEKYLKFIKKYQLSIHNVDDIKCFMIEDDVCWFQNDEEQQDEFPINTTQIAIEDIVNNDVLNDIVYSCNAGW